MGAKREKPPLRRVLKRATCDKSNVVVAGAALIAAPALCTWWVLLVGLGAVSLMVAWRMMSHGYWQKALAADRGLQLPDPLKLSDPALRATVSAIGHARAEVTRVLADTPPEVQAQVARALPSIDELEHCAARLVRRADALTQYLSTVKRERVEDEIDRLNDLERRAFDEEAQREYARAKVVRREQLAALDEVRRAHERAGASLLRVVAAIDALPARIVRLGLLDAEAREDLAGELDDELERLNGEIATAEQVLRGLEGPESRPLLASLAAE